MMRDFIRIKVISDTANRVREETLWARRLAGVLCEVRSLPIFFEGINKMDIVEVDFDERDLPRVVSLVRSGGHQTVRILFLELTSTTERKQIAAHLREFGVEMEEGIAGLWSIDISQEQQQNRVSSYLSALRELGRLECETDVGMAVLLAQWRHQKGF